MINPHPFREFRERIRTIRFDFRYLEWMEIFRIIDARSVYLKLFARYEREGGKIYTRLDLLFVSKCWNIKLI